MASGYRNDPGSGWRKGLAGDRPHGHAQRVLLLALLVQEVLKRDPLGGHIFCFRGRRGDLIKVIWHDGQAASLYVRRLEKGRFLWPSPADGIVTITPAQMGYLLSGNRLAETGGDLASDLGRLTPFCLSYP